MVEVERTVVEGAVLKKGERAVAQCGTLVRVWVVVVVVVGEV